jgi:ankyrin repeat protein
MKIMQLLVEKAGPALILSADGAGRLATHYAAKNGRVEALAYLLQHGVGAAQAQRWCALRRRGSRACVSCAPQTRTP